MAPKSHENLHTPDTEKVEKKKSIRTRDKFIGAGAAAALALGLAACGDGENVNATPGPSETTISEAPTHTPDPIETIEPNVFEVTPFSPEFSNDEAARHFGEVSSAWANVGVREGLMDSYLEWRRENSIPDSKDAMMQLYREMATENAQLFIETLLVDDWEDNPNLVDYVEKKIEQNAIVLYNNAILQIDTDEKWETPPMYNLEILSTQVSDDGLSRTLEIYADSDNRDGTRTGSLIYIPTLINEGGIEKMSDFTYRQP